MKRIQLLTLLAASLALAACDPYDDADNGPAELIRVIAVDGHGATPPTEGVLDPATGVWTIEDVTSTCVVAGGVGTPIADQSGIYATFSNLIRPESVQADPAACTSSADADAWFTATGDIAADELWWACYQPASATSVEGASVIFTGGPTPRADDPATPAVDETIAPTDGLNAVVTSGDAVTTHSIAGEVTDLAGRQVPVNFTVTFRPNPGTVDVNLTSSSENLTFTPAPTTMRVQWAAAKCGTPGTTLYLVERAPNVPNDPATAADDAAGTYVEIAADLTATEFTDTGLTAATKYWYRVTAYAPTSPDDSGPSVVDSETTAAAP